MPRSKLKQRTDGRFRCWYKGKQFYGATMKEAYQKRDAYKMQIELGVNPERITVRVYGEYWLPIATGTLAEQSRYKAKRALDILFEDIGDYALQDVRPGMIKSVFTKHFDGLSDDYISHAKTVYSGLFSAAVADRYINVNPCADKAAKPHKGKTANHRPLTDEEIRIVETCAVDHRVHAVAMVMLYAGLRPAEAQALSMDDVDFEKKQIHVCASYHEQKGSTNQRVRTNAMKLGSAPRYVPLFSVLADCLRGREGLLIQQKDGSLSRTAWASAWKSYIRKLRKESGTDIKFRPYDLRHTFCTMCRDNSVELHTCIEWMGHATPKMIIAVYDSVTKNRIQTEADRMENAIKNRTKKD